MKEYFAKLIDVKSIVTLVLTAVFAILAITKVVSGEQFLTVFTMIISFYFGIQSTKIAGATTGSDTNEQKND